NGKILVGEKEEEIIVMTDKYTEHKIKLFKESNDKNSVKDAKIEILNENLDKIDEWISDGKEHEIKLPFGNYIIREVQAPQGYKKIIGDINISIGKDGKIKTDNKNIKINENEIHIINEKNTDSVINVEVPPTSKNISTIIKVTALLLITITIGLYFYHKRV
ncbi:MAG: hypothetical protein IKG40_04835, partial [Bacilli bacterium]|nr:hypothetical protein [Bacilli bacterium]